MNSQELWMSLNNKSDKEIKIEVVMMILYLVKSRQVDFKEFIKEIRKLCKERGV